MPSPESPKSLTSLTPPEIVAELDKFIIGQAEAKRKVAVALRNRWRRQQLPDDLKRDVNPKNIILIGPTGVGKTEIARRLARMADAPFVKVEASKFTEVGYVGRDCESMIRELTDGAINLIKTEMEAELKETAAKHAEKKLLDILLPPQPQPVRPIPAFKPTDPSAGDEGPAPLPDQNDGAAKAREVVKKKLEAGDLEEKEIEIDVRETNSMPMMQVFSNSGMEEMGMNLQDMFGKMMPKRSHKRKVTVAEARQILIEEEIANLIDMDVVTRRAIERTENLGIVFLDEVDKIAGRGGGGSHGPDVSREGVQRDILPIVEGSTVTTKYGQVRTDHILFIAAGAFHTAKVSDLIPELQGRFPIRVEMDSLGRDEFLRILREPKNSLIHQYVSLLETEGVTLTIADDAIDAMADLCQQFNQESENIGARRLHTIMEYVLEDISYNAGEYKGREITITGDVIRDRLAQITEEQDLSRYIL